MADQSDTLRDAMSERVGVLIENVPEDVRAAVENDARARDRNRNDVICEILATRFRVRYEPTRYPYRPTDGSAQWNIRMPIELREASQRAAEAASRPGRRIARTRLIIATLQAHYDLPVDSPRRRSAIPPLDPDVVRDARARVEAGESIRSLARRYGVPREKLTKAVRTV